MIKQAAFTKTEQEIVILRAVWDLIDDMVNYRTFEKEHGIEDTQLRFRTASDRRLFNILLVDFLSKPRQGSFNLPGPSKGSPETPETKGAKMAEAAQANRDGLECSSYTWQVRHRLHTRFGSECQE